MATSPSNNINIANDLKCKSIRLINSTFPNIRMSFIFLFSKKGKKGFLKTKKAVCLIISEFAKEIFIIFFKRFGKLNFHLTNKLIDFFKFN